MNWPGSSIILRSTLLIALSFSYVLLVGCGPVQVVDESELRVADIPSVFEKLSSDGSYGSYAVFIPKKPDADLGEHLNLQFSYENGSAGFDWVLLSPVNIRDQQRLIDLAKTLGITMEAHEMNDVRYLRAEGPVAPQLCQSVLTEMYGLSADDKINFFVEGFDLP
jgi:hypothetical protein